MDVEKMKARLQARAAVNVPLGVMDPAKPSKGMTEIERASSTPRRVAAAPPDLTSKYKLVQGSQKLRALQNEVLWELENLPTLPHQPRGVAGLLGVGAGKTLLTILAPLAVNAERPVLMLPPDMKSAFGADYNAYGKHWRRHPKFRIMTYSELSVASGEERLKLLNPDLLIFDEAHNLASADSARTRKMVRYLEEHPQCKVLLLSGTLTKKSLKDFAHLLRLTLRDWSPLPTTWSDLEAWSNVLDSKGLPNAGDWYPLRHLYKRGDRHMREEQDLARRAFGEHLAGNRCVISLPNTETCEATILFRQMPTPEGLPSKVLETLKNFERSWTRPDGEEINCALDAFRLRQQLSQGFYYKWDWPGGVVDKDWMERRQRWNRACRAVLKEHLPGLDSPLQVIRSIQNGTLGDLEAESAWESWDQVRKKPPPPTVAVWTDTFLVKKAVDWAKTHKRGIIWYNDNAMGDALAASGIPTFGGGTTPVLENGAVACSIRAQGTGKNLQKYADNLILSFPSNGARAEQLIGRTHRPGQEADEVQVSFWAETDAQKDAVRSAVKDAFYQQNITHNPQKLLVGTWDISFDRFESPKDDVGGDEDDDGEEGDVREY